MKIGNYHFELKSIKVLESRSEETNCFGAVLYVNGKRFADCGNDGNGGCTDVTTFPYVKDLRKEIESFLKEQPKVKPEGYDFELQIDLEYIVDTLLAEHLGKKYHEKMVRLTKKKLVFLGTNKQYYSIGWKGLSLEQVLKTSNGPGLVKKEIIRELSTGSTLFNTNIPENLLKEIEDYRR